MITDKVYLVMETRSSIEIIREVCATEMDAELTLDCYMEHEPKGDFCISEKWLEDELDGSVVYLVVEGERGDLYDSDVINICGTKECAEKCIENLYSQIDPGEYYIETMDV